MALIAIAALLCLSLGLQGTLAQPQRPVLPKSFSFIGAATYLGGKAQVSYAYDSNTGNTAFTFQMTQGCQAAATLLARYDTGKLFTIFSVGPFYSCNPMPSGGKPPAGVGMFDWVANAVYQGPSSTLLPGIPLDVWASNLTGRIGDLLLGVSPNDSSTPVILWSRGPTTTTDLMYYFISFVPATPDSYYFKIPSFCPPSLKHEQAHSMKTQMPQMVMPPFKFDPTGKVFKNMFELH